MSDSIIGKILWLAVENSSFRKRLIEGMGNALAEEGFVLTDGEMATLRDYYDSVKGLTAHRAAERFAALARDYGRG